jgi:hypothetical protein
LLDELLTALDAGSAFASSSGFRIDIDELFAEGLQAGFGSGIRDPDVQLVQWGGRVPGGSAATLDANLRELARLCVTWYGEAGHFIEILSPTNETGVADEDATAILLLHTGSIELGMGYLRNAVGRGMQVSYNQGIDISDDIAEGFWGLDPTSRIGQLLLAGSVGLTNYGFVRRLLLQELTRRLFERVFGCEVNARLISDIVHTCVLHDGDAYRYQQGVQLLDGMRSAVQALVAGGPAVRSFLVQPVDGCIGLCHGKAEVYDNLKVRPMEASAVARECLTNYPTPTDIAVMDAQVREAVSLLRNDRMLAMAEAVVPILSMHGRNHGRPKL